MVQPSPVAGVAPAPAQTPAPVPSSPRLSSLYHGRPNHLHHHHHHHRRSSVPLRRGSHSSNFPSILKAESPRTPCPADHGAFAYDPAHLKEWYMSQELWHKLPLSLHASVASLQHAGAAVLTAFDRLQIAQQDMLQEQHELDQDTLELSPLEVAVSKDFSRSRHDSGFFSTLSTSSISLPGTSCQSTPSLSPLDSPPASSASSICSDRRSSFNDHAFTTPLSPKCSYYKAEVTGLRSESFPRLRHTARRVESEYKETRRMLDIWQRQSESGSTAGPSPAAITIVSNSLDQFGDWWAEKKMMIASVSDRMEALGGLNNQVHRPLQYRADSA